jgi:hypothetical protein
VGLSFGSHILILAASNGPPHGAPPAQAEAGAGEDVGSVLADRFRCLGAVYSITTFIRAITSLLQIRQFAQHRSATCSRQGLSPTQRSTRATPSGDLT